MVCDGLIYKVFSPKEVLLSSVSVFQQQKTEICRFLYQTFYKLTGFYAFSDVLF